MTTLPRPGSAAAWLLAARLRTLPVALAPVLVGAAVAYRIGPFDAFAVVAAALGALFIQIGTNFANDVFDSEKGADDENRIGPPRAVQKGLLTPGAMRKGMIVAFVIAALFGAYLVKIGGWPIVVVGLVSIASGIAYTGGPYPLGYNGLGDVFVFVFFGLVAVCGTTWVGAGVIPPLAIVASLPVGMLATAVIVVNNVRDVDTDVRANKRTLAVRFGRRFGVIEYGALVVLAHAASLFVAASGWASIYVALTLATLPRGLRLTSILARERDGVVLSGVLAQTAQLLLLHALLLAIGIATKA